MRDGKTLILSCLIFSAVGENAQAALVNAGGGMVNDTDLNVTWTQDANLFLSMVSSNPALVGQITSVTATINDPHWGIQTIDDGTNDGIADFDTGTGMMTWWGAQAWMDYLNSINYGGVNGWRLPQVTPGNGVSFNYAFSYDGSTDVGFNTTTVNTLANELAHVYYNELGNLAAVSTSGTPQSGSGVTNGFPFSNLGNGVYWSGTDYVPHPGAAWVLITANGNQIHDDKGAMYYAWPVRSGQVAVVPAPPALYLLGSGILGLARFWYGRQAA